MERDPLRNNRLLTRPEVLPLALAALLVVCSDVYAQPDRAFLITTAPWDDTRGFGGDGGPAIAALLKGPYGVADDASGDLDIADSGKVRPFIVGPSADGCVYSLDAATQSFGLTGGSGNVAVLVNQAGCSWLAVSNVAWITVTSGSSGSANGVVSYFVAPNGNWAARIGTLSIAGKTFTVTQPGVTCSFSIDPSSVSVPSGGVIGGVVSVTTNAPDCQWRASSSTGWILVSGGAGTTGSGKAMYTVGINSDTLRTGTITIAGKTFTINQSAAVAITPGGVLNGADYTSAVAPGMIVSVFGDSMALNVSSAAGTPLPTVLAGTSVEVNGKAIPLFFVSPNQINAQMPFGVSGQVQVRVRSAAGDSAVVPVSVEASAPRLFTKTMDGKGEPILVHSADWSLVSAASPARPGEYLILFLTGLGEVSPSIPAGQAGGDDGTYGPLNQLPSDAVKITFGGKQVRILFAGLAPTWVGLYQINLQVPADMPRGTFRLVASTKDGSSQAGILAAAEGAVMPPPATNMEFVSIPAGEFMMGCSPGDTECKSDEGPQHRVQITKNFEMGKYEVMQAQWQAVMGTNPSYFKGDARPVDSVSWNDIQGFLTKLNERNDGYRYRLPTEAEWEYAARAGSTDKYAGGTPSAVACTGSSGTCNVGQKKPNAWGLFDVLGNVWEWCQDWYGGSYYSASPTADPQGPSTGSSKVLRGESWGVSFYWYLSVSNREGYFVPGNRYNFIGFRCVRER